ncbi:hypothetical protein BD289DRAFT_479269 [Coniella lustricola]|uniref:Uncharacterized protein n=1 Tax=Coniella lustricola TaxID=2025994 RepID=A0A2T3AJZ2_9PEZI|nr:hypothetical protein BD289DRAFT_479269 [Coniella lustricola]
MQLSHLFSAAAAQALVSNALVVLPRQTNITDAHLANFRTWGAANCPGAVDNQGEWNEQLFDLNICYQFPSSLEVVSVQLENIDTGDYVTCNAYVFTDSDCTVDEVALPGVGVCYTYTKTSVYANPGLGSYKIACADN